LNPASTLKGPTQQFPAHALEGKAANGRARRQVAKSFFMVVSFLVFGEAGPASSGERAGR